MISTQKGTNKTEMKMIDLVKLVIIASFLYIGHVQSRKSLELERNILNRIFDGYDPSIRPAGDNGTGM
ncbi:hypothetical protein NPIL_666581 [Nephila pilipes]|uniref:Uncharacterized protein n=1 Tax=Nephila pilipes TaxID=299642 RepID=A0A8X6QRF9_NEPPI|nr:hypothetical protein NPIL_666581 [Nephila pilipes]